MCLKRCKTKTKKGKPCKAPAVGNNGYCFFHDPDREADRQAARERGAKAPRRKTVVLGNDVSLTDAEGVRALLAALLEEVINAPTDGYRMNIIKKARCAGYLGGILLRAIELSELEKRISALEEDLNA
jgi:hypothetical protein